MRNLFQDGLSQMWFNTQKMERDERKQAIKNIIKSSRCNGSFINYRAKYFLASLIDQSECYFNGLGYHTKVKEFDKLGWYVVDGINTRGEKMYSLSFNKIMQ
jgi:streptomycin 6-kinase